MLISKFKSLEPFFRIRVRQLGFACLLRLDIKIYLYQMLFHVKKVLMQVGVGIGQTAR